MRNITDLRSASEKGNPDSRLDPVAWVVLVSQEA